MLFYHITCGKHHIVSLIREEFKDTKEVIRIHKSKKDRQYNDQKKKTSGAGTANPS
jgi:hypothetical protein